MIDISARNRAIKKVCEQAFGKGKVSVRAHRGTSWGWLTVHIAHSPRNWPESRELEAKVLQLIGAANIELQHFYGDEGTGAKMSCIHINFDKCQDRVAADEALDDFNYVGSRHHY